MFSRSLLRSRRWLFRVCLVAFSLSCATALRAQDSAHPLTLENAIQMALQRNKIVKVNAFFRPIARANVLAEKGRFDPSLTFSRTHAEDGTPASADPLVQSLVKTDTTNFTLDGLTPWGLTYSLGSTAQNLRGTFNGFVDSYGTFDGITLSQPLLRGFGFGVNLAGLRIAKAQRAISDWDFRQTIIDTVTQVVFAFSDVIFANENLRIARRARDLSAGIVRDNERRFKAGNISESDVLQARAQAAEREEPILYAERGVRDSDNALRRLLGEENFTLDGPLLSIEQPPLPDLTVNLSADLKSAYDTRPDFQATRLGLTKFRATEQSARNELLPRVDLVGSYGYHGLDRDLGASRRMVSAEDNRSYSAGIVVNVPITFAQGRGHARAARLSLRQAEADLQRLAQDIALNVTNAAGQIETTRLRVVSARQAYELANQALNGELKKLQAGTTSTFFVLSLQNTLINIESDLSRALADQRRAIAAYERELGTTLTRYKINPVSGE